MPAGSAENRRQLGGRLNPAADLGSHEAGLGPAKTRRLEGRKSARGFADSAGGVQVVEQFVEDPLAPVAELRERLLAQIDVHLQAGRWSHAHIVLTAGLAEARQIEIEAHPEQQGVEWRLARSLYELPITYRTCNALELQAGLFTVADVLEAWPGRLWDLKQLGKLPNFGVGAMRETGLALVAWRLIDWEVFGKWDPDQVGPGSMQPKGVGKC